MLPSLGYFGGTWVDRIDLPYRQYLTKLHIQRADSANDFLNLHGVLARREGKVVQFGASDITIRQSTVREANNYNPQGLSSLENLHTLKEVNPWWEVTLTHPTRIDAFQIFNRPDCLGIRSRALRVTATNDSDERSVLYDSTSKIFLQQTIDQLQMLAGGLISEEPITSLSKARKWRDDAVNAIASRLRQGAPLLDRTLRNALCALIPTRRPSNNWTHLQGDDWFLLAYVLCSQEHMLPGSRSSYKNYELVLPTTNHLERLESEFDSATRAIGARPMQLLSHGVSELGQLRSRLPEIRRLISELHHDLEDEPNELFAAYGTLLGGIRSGAIIDHDDDFDVFVTIAATTREAFDKELSRILHRLTTAGWKVHRNGTYLNSHISKPGTNAQIDLFGLWLNEDTAVAHMDGMKLRNMPSSWFDKGELLDIDGIKIHAPLHAEQFLELRYGPTWKTPDKYHDWRCKLN